MEFLRGFLLRFLEKKSTEFPSRIPPVISSGIPPWISSETHSRIPFRISSGITSEIPSFFRDSYVIFLGILPGISAMVHSDFFSGFGSSLFAVTTGRSSNIISALASDILPGISPYILSTSSLFSDFQ